MNNGSAIFTSIPTATDGPTATGEVPPALSATRHGESADSSFEAVMATVVQENKPVPADAKQTGSSRSTGGGATAKPAGAQSAEAAGQSGERPTAPGDDHAGRPPGAGAVATTPPERRPVAPARPGMPLTAESPGGRLAANPTGAAGPQSATGLQTMVSTAGNANVLSTVVPAGTAGPAPGKPKAAAAAQPKKPAGWTGAKSGVRSSVDTPLRDGRPERPQPSGADRPAPGKGDRSASPGVLTARPEGERSPAKGVASAPDNGNPKAAPVGARDGGAGDTGPGIRAAWQQAASISGKNAPRTATASTGSAANRIGTEGPGNGQGSRLQPAIAVGAARQSAGAVTGRQRKTGAAATVAQADRSAQSAKGPAAPAGTGTPTPSVDLPAASRIPSTEIEGKGPSAVDPGDRLTPQGKIEAHPARPGTGHGKSDPVPAASAAAVNAGDQPATLDRSVSGRTEPGPPANDGGVKAESSSWAGNSKAAEAVLDPAGLGKSTGTATKETAESVMSQIVDRFKLALTPGTSRVTIRLHPDHLGPVHLRIVSNNDHISVRIMTELPMVKEMIEGQVGQLKSEMSLQGLSLEKFDVNLLTENDGRQFDDHNRNAQEFTGRRQRPKSGAAAGRGGTVGDEADPPPAGPASETGGLSVMA
jgi:hypothetical protein